MSSYIAVIIIGAARSGTKFLRGLLDASERCRVVPYDVNYVWRYGNEDHPHDELPADGYDERIGMYVRSALDRMAPGEGDLLVEKTVSNTLRVPFVARIFPQARFIHIVRDGHDVVESSFRKWQDPSDWGYLLRKARSFPWRHYRYALWHGMNVGKGLVAKGRGASVWGPRYAGIEEDVRELTLAEVCAWQWRRTVESALSGLQSVPHDRRLTLRYEDLVTSSSPLDAIGGFLGLPDLQAIRDRYARTVRHDTGERWREAFKETERARILEIIEPTLHALGYESRHEPFTA